MGPQRCGMQMEAMARAGFGSKTGAMAAELSDMGCGCAHACDIAMEEVRSTQA
jgi:hypothetical protein